MHKDRSQKPEFRRQETGDRKKSIGHRERSQELENFGLRIADCEFKKAKSVMEIDLNNFANRNLQSEMIE